MNKRFSNSFLLQQLKMEGRILQTAINDMEYYVTVLQKEEQILYNMLFLEESANFKNNLTIVKVETISSASEDGTSHNQTVQSDSKKNGSPPKRIKTFHNQGNDSVTGVPLEELDLAPNLYTKSEEEEEEDEEDAAAA